MSAYTKGFVVMSMDDDNKSKQISRVFHARQAAVDFMELALKTNPKMRYFVADKVGYDKGIEAIK